MTPRGHVMHGDALVETAGGDALRGKAGQSGAASLLVISEGNTCVGVWRSVWKSPPLDSHAATSTHDCAKEVAATTAIATVAAHHSHAHAAFALVLAVLDNVALAA